jgi:hypothetical protein
MIALCFYYMPQILTSSIGKKLKTMEKKGEGKRRK